MPAVDSETALSLMIATHDLWPEECADNNCKYGRGILRSCLDVVMGQGLDLDKYQEEIRARIAQHCVDCVLMADIDPEIIKIPEIPPFRGATTFSHG